MNDTGAGNSVCHSSPAEKKRETYSTLQDVNKSSTTNGQRLHTLNSGLRRAYQWIFIIADVALHIIGVDFLGNFSLLLYIKHRRVIDAEPSLFVNGIESPAQPLSPTSSIPMVLLDTLHY